MQVEDKEMRDGMKNEQGQVETLALRNARKQSQLKWSSGKGWSTQVWPGADMFYIAVGIDDTNGAAVARAAETDRVLNLV